MNEGKNFTQVGLAEKIGLRESAISMFETNLRRPKLERIQKPAEIGKDISESFRGNIQTEGGESETEPIRGKSAAKFSGHCDFEERK